MKGETIERLTLPIKDLFGAIFFVTVGMLIRQYLHKHYRERSAIIRGYLLLADSSHFFVHPI